MKTKIVTETIGSTSGGIFFITLSGTGSNAGGPAVIRKGTSVAVGKADPGTASQVNIFQPNSYAFSLTNRTGNAYAFIAFKFGA